MTDSSASAHLVFVVDDDVQFRNSVRQLLESVHLKVKTFATAAEFLASYTPDQPSCLVLDVRMPGMSGMELQKKLGEDNVTLPIIIITGHAEIPMAVEAMRQGAIDFLQKPYSPQQFLERVQQALKLDEEARALEEKNRQIRQRVESLSEREREVLELLVQGKSTKQIASTLGISTKTVDFHRRNVLEKMLVESVVELALLVDHHLR